MVSSPKQKEKNDPFFIMETIRNVQIKRKEEYNTKDWFSENDTKPTVALLLFLGFVFTESVFKT